MQVGDLVEWIPNFFDENGDRYCNPGLIIQSTKIVNSKYKYVIMWANGKFTVEFGGYLKCFQK